MSELIKKTIRCPNCKHVFTITGLPGEIKKVVCPNCYTIGKIVFEKSKDIAISVSHLTKIYGDLIAVDDISFEVKRGEVFAFLGPNGAGKTTTVEMIESIRKPTKGLIKIFGKDISKSFSEIKERIGVLPQEFKSFERLTVRETLEYFSSLFNKHIEISKSLKEMNLEGEKDKLYKDLSGGLKQRVGVAIALVNDPDIIFLDEPTTGLDPKARREVWDVISNLKRQGKTIFLTTHYMEEAEYLADYVAIIHKGKIIAEGTVDELIQRYGKGNTLHINGNPKVYEFLKEKGFNVEISRNNGVTMHILRYSDILEVLSLLKDNNIEYDSIDIRRPNLEEVFLTLTGAKLSEGTI